MSLLTRLLDYLEQEVAWDDVLSGGELAQIRMMISSLLHLLHKQEEHRTLSKRQKSLLVGITEVEQLLLDTQIINKADQKVFSLWSLLEENSDAQDGLLLRRFSFKSLFLIFKANAQLYYQDRTQGNNLYEKCQTLANRLNDITAQKGFFGSLKRWLLEDSFGTIDQVIDFNIVFVFNLNKKVREEISSRYDSKQVTLQVEKNARLDWY